MAVKTIRLNRRRHEVDGIAAGAGNLGDLADRYSSMLPAQFENPDMVFRQINGIPMGENDFHRFCIAGHFLLVARLEGFDAEVG